MRVYLICPDFNNAVSGGNLYNKKLIEASQGQITPVFYDCDTIFSKIKEIPKYEIILIDSLILNKIGHLLFTPFTILCHLPSSMNSDSDAKAIDKEINLYKKHSIIVTGYRMKDKLVRTFDVKSTKIFTIQPGVDDLIKKQYYKSTIERLVWVGNLSPIKGFLEMLDHLKQIIHYKWHLDVYGSTDININYTVSIKDKIAHYNLENRIAFKQALPHDRLMEELPNYDLMLQFSRFESFGMAVFEALNIGLPVLGLHLNQEPYFDIFVHAHSVENSKEWCNKLLLLIENPKDTNNTNQIEARTWDHVYQDFLAVVRQ